MIGRTLSHYRIFERLGAGGMGEVYRARDDRLQRDIALKVLPRETYSDETARKRLLGEARAAAALNHPNICTIHDVGETDGQPYIAMELVEGECLSDSLQGHALPTPTVLRYGIQIADALSHAHEQRIVHRDLKCANVVVTPDGRVKVLDFGLAKRLPGEVLTEATTQSQLLLTLPGTVVGTLSYMAPEQLLGKPADARSDLWALGIVLYEMAVGVRPFGGATTFELSSAILNQPTPPLPSKLPLQLRAIVDRCLAKQPAQRYQRASEVRASLETLQTGSVVSRGSVRYALGRHRRLGLSALLLGVLGVVAAFDVGGLRSALVGGGASAGIGSLAVLPLENLSQDPDENYFAAGIHDALITDLASLGGMRVTPRGSVMRFGGPGAKPPSEIARDLNVDALITGAVLRAGERVRITIQMIDPVSDEQLWAQRYERDLRDVISLQNEIVLAIVSELKIQLTPQQEERLAEARTVDPEAYEAYLKGGFYRSKLSPDGYRMALEYYRLALAKDSDYASAHAAIATTGLSQAHMGFVPPLEIVEQAKEAVLRAIALDDTQADVHDSMAGIHLYLEWDWPAADLEFQRVRELKPQNWGCTSSVYADYLLVMGRREEALVDMRRCLESNPLNFWVEAAFGGRLLRIGRYEEGIGWLHKALKTEPDLALAHRYLWYAYDHQQRFDAALEEARTFFTLKGQKEVAEAMTRGYTEDGYSAAMRHGADRLVAIAEHSYVQGTRIAGLYALGGETQRALDWLDRAYEERDSWLTFVGDDVRFTSLHSEPRFRELLGRMNIAFRDPD